MLYLGNSRVGIFPKVFVLTFLVILLHGCGPSMTYRKSTLVKKPITMRNINPTTARDSRPPERKVALLVPLYGKNSVLGKQVIDGATMALFDGNIKNIKLMILDSGDTAESAMVAAREAARMRVHSVIGPIFSKQAKAVTGIFNDHSIDAIAISNDISVASKYMHVFGILEEKQLTSTMHFINNHQKKNVVAILPSNNVGFAINKKILRMSSLYGMNLVTSEYYQPGNVDLYKKVASRVSMKYKTSYKISKDGDAFVENIRDKNQNHEKKDDYQIKYETIDAVYINATGDDLLGILSSLEKYNLLSKDIMIICSDIPTKNLKHIGSNIRSRIMISNVSNKVEKDQFDAAISSHFRYEATKISMLSYDAMSVLGYVMQKSSYRGLLMNPGGFSGVSGDFVFDSSGSVKRKFNMYQLTDHGLELVEETSELM